MKKLILLTVFLVTANVWAEDIQPPVNCLEDFKEEGGPYVYDDRCIYQSKIGNIITIDIKVKEEDNELIYDIPYHNLRYAGAIVQIYISGAFGKSQWFAMPFLRGVIIMPGSIHLPIDEWVEDGFPVDNYLRVVILTSES